VNPAAHTPRRDSSARVHYYSKGNSWKNHWWSWTQYILEDFEDWYGLEIQRSQACENSLFAWFKPRWSKGATNARSRPDPSSRFVSSIDCGKRDKRTQMHWSRCNQTRRNFLVCS
jgi:hypothetical protein